METLWNRLQREAYQECRQLTGNRLAERIKLGLARENDVLRMIARRVPAYADEAPRDLAKDETVTRAVKAIMTYVEQNGNLAFVRDVITRVVRLSEGHDAPDLNCWASAIDQEVKSR